MSEVNDKAACEAALTEAFAAFLPLMQECDVTTKRALELFAAAQARAMSMDGKTMLEIGRVTGFSYKKVQELVANGPKPDKTDKVARVHAAWLSDHTLPPELPHNPKEPISTYTLCERYGRDLTTPELVRALVERKLATMKGDVLVRSQKHYVACGLVNKLGIAGRSIRDLASTAAYNLRDDVPYLLPQMRVYTSRTPAGHISELRKDLRACADRCHEDVRAVLKKYEEPTLAAGDQIGIGLYVFEHSQTDGE